MRRTRSLIFLAVTAAALSLGSLVGVSPVEASASTQPAVVAQAPDVGVLACEPHIGVTHRDGDYIVGHGSLSSGCGPSTSATLRIQRHRWYGWETVKTLTFQGPGADHPIRYNCADTGTHDFRTQVSSGGTTKTSNTIRENCGG